MFLCICRRDGSGVSLDSLNAQLRSPTSDNYDSSDSDYDNKDEETQVITSKTVVKSVRYRYHITIDKLLHPKQ